MLHSQFSDLLVLLLQLRQIWEKPNSIEVVRLTNLCPMMFSRQLADYTTVFLIDLINGELLYRQASISVAG